VTIVDAGVRKPLDIQVIVPVDDMGALGEIIDESGGDLPSGPTIIVTGAAVYLAVLAVKRLRRGLGQSVR